MPFPHIAEILKLICDNLVSEKPTLASLARTCTSFREPALDVLWSELAGFYPLTKCLPTQISRTEKDVQRIKLSRPLTREDCSRFQYFSRKVHQFTTTVASHTPMVHNSVYFDIQAAILSETFLPNIQNLSWDCRSVSYGFVPMFLGPRLSIIKLTVSPTSNGEMSLISGLCQRYSSLTSVTILFSPGASIERSRLAVEHLSNPGFTWASLSELTLPNVTYSNLIRISRLPRLKSLTFVDFGLDDSDSNKSISGNPKGGFPALDSLNLMHCRRASDCTAILKLMDCSPLGYISAKIWQKETSESWRQLFLAVSQHCDHAKLDQLACFDAQSPDDHEITTVSRSDMVTYEDLKPLLGFRRFRWLEIEAFNGFYFDDPAMIGEMAKSWTHIEELRFRILPFSRTNVDGVSKITPSDLVALAMHCPKLKLLTLPLDASSPPNIAAEHPWIGKIPSTNLSILSIGDSPIAKPNLVGANLSAIFPSLQQIKTIEHEEALILKTTESMTGRNKAWNKAERQMKFATRIRIQERRRARVYYTTNDNAQSADEEYGAGSSDDNDDMDE